jgi:hypothetical protein
MTILLLMSEDQSWMKSKSIQTLKDGAISPVDISDLSTDQPEELKAFFDYLNTVEYTRILVWLGNNGDDNIDMQKYLKMTLPIYSWVSNN